jgi:hypothetical protein
MSNSHKNYYPLPDETIDRLLSESCTLITTKYGCMNLPARTVHALISEVQDAREEIFRLQLCETVDSILADELGDDDFEAEEDLLSFDWPSRSLTDEDDMISGVLKPASAKKATARLARVEFPIDDNTGSNPDDASRRLPRME